MTPDCWKLLEGLESYTTPSHTLYPKQPNKARLKDIPTAFGPHFGWGGCIGNIGLYD